MNIGAKCQAQIARTAYQALQKSKQLQYWLAIILRKQIMVTGPRAEIPTAYYKQIGSLSKEVSDIQGKITSKVVYKYFTESSPPSRIEARQNNPERQCKRMYSIKDPVTANLKYEILSETLLTQPRLNKLNLNKKRQK